MEARGKAERAPGQKMPTRRAPVRTAVHNEKTKRKVIGPYSGTTPRHPRSLSKGINGCFEQPRRFDLARFPKISNHPLPIGFHGHDDRGQRIFGQK